ncbi:hypothetical protein SAMN05216474_1288 [Lishizhenia tianjinensis]|uniref:40-residue YVTN family beta-propeller repeat-containing protein n=1 Tax=Lishizhenia tianjinensis TaxID=477690 RepID=A0A1I6YYB6_9FLAO|nr:DUF5074 domain-containing protein [Lishizhenia tianjinensis]SFT55459.1 hypothetical protein SAMN05216474_1288 [Lishizhenia tianjinensis]
MKFSIYIVFLGLLLLACKEDPLPEPDNTGGKEGLLLLNEGLFQQNNASLSFIDSEDAITNDYFLQQNERLLGDTGNDMIVYGGKVYIVVHASSTIEVLDKSSLKSVKQINLQHQGVNQLPRFVVGHGAFIYVSTYDGFVNKIDTSSFTVSNRVAVGNNPEGLAISNDKIFVANSGGLNSPNYDSTVSVIDLATLQVTDEIFIGANIGELTVDSEGDVYVVKRGNYSNDPSELFVLDAQNNYQKSNLGIAATSLFMDEDDKLWIAHLNYGNNTSNVAVIDAASETVLSSNFINASDIQSLYGIFVDEEYLYCMDARGFTLTGNLKKYNKNTGVFVEEFDTGLNPNTLVKIKN